MDTLLHARMSRITKDSLSGVTRLDLESTYYVKTFNGPGNRLQHFLGIGRYQRELHNLQYFSKLGLATPELVAYGQTSRLGLLQQAVMVTREVSGAVDLERFITSGQLYAKGVQGARKILVLLARATKLLHAQGFYHGDLKTRNVLVRCEGDEPELFYFDCPRGNHPPRFLLRRRIVRELAHIERGLHDHVRQVDLLHMYKQYRGCERLSVEDKALARDVLRYYRDRRINRERRSRVN
jgi:serine/threonine protein kinase